MTFGDYLRAILTTRKVWEALLALVGAVLVVVKPDFPPAIWATILTLAGLVLGSLGIKESTAKAKDMARAREMLRTPVG